MHNPAQLLHVALQSIRDAVVTTDAAARVQSLFDDHLFDAKAPATEPELRTLRRQTAQQVEMTVFQFQR